MKRLIALLSLLAGLTVSAHAITIFDTSVGKQPSNVGTVTLSQVDSDTVNVSVVLQSGYGFMNSGGQHTPFAFTLTDSDAVVTANFLTPTLGEYQVGTDTFTFSLNLAGGAATPYGSYGVAIDSDAGNGSNKAYYGVLSFDLTRIGGLLESDFIPNSMEYYFAADLTDGANTGSQAWKNPGTPSVPDGGTTAVLLGLALVGLSFVARRKVA